MVEPVQYDVIIIGAGPAGLTAGIYTARARLNTLLVENGLYGGQINNTEHIENFPGFPEGIDGLELGGLMMKQAEKFGLKTLTGEVTGLEVKDGKKIVKTSEGDFAADSVIIAGGSQRQHLEVPGEKEFAGKGVSYCATCDGAFFKDRVVAVVGGGNAAVSEALHLARFASKVVLIHRRSELTAQAIIQERAFAEPKLTFLWDTVIEAIEGEQFVRSIKLNNTKTGAKSTLEVSGVFVSVGSKPATGYVKDFLQLDPFGYIVTNEMMETSVPGIYAAGDIRANSARQAITASGDGATAAIAIERSHHTRK
jgi:thioredoxin reductase (NADPH)